jgi:predicted metal-dependent hydrolase
MLNNNKNGFMIVINIILLILIIYASTSLTVGFFGSIGEGNIKISNLLLGIVNDSCKIFFTVCVGIAVARRKFFHATTLILIVIGTMIISYLASQSLDLNISNGQLLESSNKKQLIQAKDELILEKNRLVDDKKLTESRFNKAIDDELSSWQRSELTKELEKSSKTFTDAINNVNLKIFELTDRINSDQEVSTELTTSGYHALSKSLGVSIDKIVMWKNIFLEVLGVILSMNLGFLLSKVDAFKIEPINEPQEPPSTNRVFDAVGKDKIIGFKADEVKADANIDIDDALIEKYLDYMYKNPLHEGVSRGYSTIGKEIGINTETARSIKNHLERLGLISTKGTQTLILKSRESIHL